MECPSLQKLLLLGNSHTNFVQVIKTCYDLSFKFKICFYTTVFPMPSKCKPNTFWPSHKDAFGQLVKPYLLVTCQSPTLSDQLFMSSTVWSVIKSSIVSLVIKSIYIWLIIKVQLCLACCLVQIYLAGYQSHVMSSFYLYPTWLGKIIKPNLLGT